MFGRTLYIAQNFNSNANSFKTSLTSFTSGTIFAKAAAFTITCTNNADIFIERSSDGVVFAQIYNTQIPANVTGNYTYSNDGNAYFFRIKCTQSANGDINIDYAVQAFTFYHECLISQIVSEHKAIVSVNYNTPAYQDIFMSDTPSEEIVDLAKPESQYGTVSTYVNVETDNSVPNDNILGLEESTSAKSLYQTNFKGSPGLTDPIFKYSYAFTEVKILNRFRVKGLMRLEIKAQSGAYVIDCAGRYMLVAIGNDNTEFILKTQNFSHYKQVGVGGAIGETYKKDIVIDITAENLNYQDIKKIEFRYYMDSWYSIGQWRGAPRYIELYTFRAQGSQYIEPAEEVVNKYIYYYGFADEMGPSAGGIFQNRHLIGNTSIISSKIAAYDNFDNLKVDMSADSSPFMITQNTAKFGKILQMLPFRTGVLVLTTEQELFLSAQGALTPSNYNLDFLGERGNENVTPLVIEQGFIGVERGNKLYFQGFNYANESYNREYIGRYANHLFEGKTIKQIEGLMSSDKTVFILFTDGSMARLYLDIRAGIIAFFRINIDGKISAITAIDNNDKKELWAVVDDRIVRFAGQADAKPCYLHFASKFENEDGMTSFTMPDLDSVNKQVYAVCYDDKGCWFEEVKEAAGQTHVLQKSATLVYCGQYYDSGFETLELGGANDSAAAKLKRISRCMPYFVNTAGIAVNKEKLKFDDLDNEYIKFFTGKYGGENGIPVFTNNYSTEPTLKLKSYVPLGWTLARINLSDTGS
jgi:hypothetical protein